MILLGGFALGAVLDENGLSRWKRLGQNIDEIDSKTAEVRREVEALRRKVAALRGDEATLERAAREELGYIREDEILFKLE